jgi:hypothetical protein
VASSAARRHRLYFVKPSWEVAGKSHTAFRVTEEFDPKGVRLSAAKGGVMPERQVRDGGNGHARTQTAHTA